MQAAGGRERREQEIPDAVLRQRFVDQPVDVVAVAGDEAHDPIPLEGGRWAGRDGFGGGHWSIRRDIATEVFHLKQLFVLVGEIPAMFLTVLRRVYLSSWFLNDFDIPKVVLQPAIIGVEEARSAHQGKGEDMLIVGRRKPVSDERLFAFTDYLLLYLPHPTSSSSFFREPSPEISVLSQLFQVFSADNKPSSITVQPVPELHARFSLFSAKYLEGYIGVDDRAHQ